MHKHYMVAAHRDPGLVLRLVSRLAGPDATVWLHVDAKSALEEFAEALAFPGVVLVEPRIDCVWGGFSQVETTLACVRAVLGSGRPGYVMLLSGQDYPLTTSAQREAYLDVHAGAVHIDIGRIEDVWPDQFHEKTDGYSIPLSSRPGDLKLLPPLIRMTPRKALGWVKRLNRILGVRQGLSIAPRIVLPRKSPVPQQFGGSSWWGMPWEVLQALVAWVDAHPRYAAYYRFSQCPDEMFFHTALMELKRAGIVNPPLRSNLTYIDWSEATSGNPKTFTIADLPALTTPHEGKVFARKFDSVNHPAVLDALDRAAGEEAVTSTS